MGLDPSGDVSDKTDGEQIASMVIEIEPEPKGSKAYTCKHLTADLRCGIYDDRPLMCRLYPNGKTCGWCGYQEPTQPKMPGVTFTHFVGVYWLGGGWYKMPDGSKARGPKGVVAWMQEQAATLGTGSQLSEE